MDIEGVLLTGGASRRMGEDKAKMLVQGSPLAVRVGNLLAQVCTQVTVLGREPLPTHRFLQDIGEFQGPLFALSRFKPKEGYVFVASCDLPFFDSKLVEFLATKIGSTQAAIPQLGGRLQPLCALYRAEALALAKEMVTQGETRIMRWVDRLECVVVDEHQLPRKEWVKNINSPEDLG